MGVKVGLWNMEQMQLFEIGWQRKCSSAPKIRRRLAFNHPKKKTSMSVMIIDACIRILTLCPAISH
jgi:hypothetical protein